MNYLMIKKFTCIGILLLLLLFLSPLSTFAEDGFTQKDRELLIELRVKIHEIDKRFEQIDKRFEQIDNRFDQVDQRFGDMFNFFYILAGIFTSLVAIVIGFAYWDRRTMLREAKKEAIDFIEKEGLLRRLLDALIELSRQDSKLAEALKRHNLL
jgi:hypothetical protein